MMSSLTSSPMLMSRTCASNASCVIMSWVSGNSVVRSSPLYCILSTKFATPTPFVLTRSWYGRGCPFIGRNGTLPPPLRVAEFGTSRRRKLIPHLEQVTCREPTVTPINSEISTRLFPCSTRFLICWTFSEVNFVGLPRVVSCVVNLAVRVIFRPYSLSPRFPGKAWLTHPMLHSTLVDLQG